ncbi:hypothetical protein [Enterococcus sp. LJL51]|uniref:hypothetical protein n=1 Tax=Enterococcus sp. LJL51 TaxID=3416656 RepID=UPI003CED2250
MQKTTTVLLVTDRPQQSFDVVKILYDKLVQVMTENQEFKLLLASYEEMKERFISADIVLLGYPNQALIARLSYLYGKTSYVDLIDLSAYSVIDAQRLKRQILTIDKLTKEAFNDHHQLKWNILCTFKKKSRK